MNTFTCKNFDAVNPSYTRLGYKSYYSCHNFDETCSQI